MAKWEAIAIIYVLAQSFYSPAGRISPQMFQRFSHRVFAHHSRVHFVPCAFSGKRILSPPIDFFSFNQENKILGVEGGKGSISKSNSVMTRTFGSSLRAGSSVENGAQWK